MTDRRPSPEELYATNTVGELVADAQTAKDLGFTEDYDLFMAAAKVGYTVVRDRIFDRANQIALKSGPFYDQVQAQLQADNERKEREATWKDLDDAAREAAPEKPTN